MKIKSGYILREVAGKSIVVPSGDINFNGIITLNESGVLLWKALENGADEKALVAVLLDNYDVSESVAENDVKKVVKILREHKLLDE